MTSDTLVSSVVPYGEGFDSHVTEPEIDETGGNSVRKDVDDHDDGVDADTENSAAVVCLGCF
jgi:hypothetical protein